MLSGLRNCGHRVMGRRQLKKKKFLFSALVKCLVSKAIRQGKGKTLPSDQLKNSQFHGNIKLSNQSKVASTGR